MERVKRASAVAVLPAAPVGGTPGFFAAPNPGGGVDATVPGYEWHNGIQEELMAVIEAQGLAGSSSDHTLLRQAITKMIQSSQRAVVIDGAVFNAGVADGNAVYLDSANARFDKAIADGSAKQNSVGFADVTNSKLYAFGRAVLFSGLMPSGRYYLDGTTAGAITTTVPSSNVVFVGIAKSATEMFVDIDVGTQRSFTTTKFTSGSGTYATPAGCKQLHVRMVGAGGGGGGAGSASPVSATAGGTGGTTSFNSINAVGGFGGAPFGGTGGGGGYGGTGTCDVRLSGGAGQTGVNFTVSSLPGGIGGCSALGGGGAAGTPGAVNTGGGGGGGIAGSTTLTGGGGGAGEYVELTITSPAATYAYAVGAGGTAGIPGTNGNAGGAGSAGVILITEFY